VFGATGNVGRELVPLLVARGCTVKIVTRNAARAAAFGDSVEVVEGDLGRTASVRPAIAGADAIYLVTMINAPDHDLAVAQLARNAGVRHIVKLSTLEASEARLRVGRWHRAKEDAIRASGLGWTILRPGMFMSNALDWADPIREAGKVFFPGGSGRVAPIDPRDVAAVAALALTEPGHAGKAYELTGDQLLTIADMTGIIGRTIGRELQYVDIPVLAAQLFLTRTFGWETARGLSEMARALKRGEGAIITPTFREVTSRGPRSFEEWCKENADAFR
jgi:uncharacterized protein YbjT (DUF2867 family)